jgi:hypothetical protein
MLWSAAAKIALGAIKTLFVARSIGRHGAIAARRIGLARAVAFGERLAFGARPLVERAVATGRVAGFARLVFTLEFRTWALCFTGTIWGKIPLRTFAIGSHRTVTVRRIRLARPIAFDKRFLWPGGRLAACLSTFAGTGSTTARSRRLRTALARVFFIVVVHCGLCSFARLDNRIMP